MDNGLTYVPELIAFLIIIIVIIATHIAFKYGSFRHISSKSKAPNIGNDPPKKNQTAPNQAQPQSVDKIKILDKNNNTILNDRDKSLKDAAKALLEAKKTNSMKSTKESKFLINYRTVNKDLMISSLKYLKSGELDLAIKDLSNIIKNDDKHYDAIILRSQAYLQKFKSMSQILNELDAAALILENSLADAERSIAVMPMKDDGWKCKVNILISIEEYENAQQMCVEGLKYIPASEDLKSMKSKIDVSLSQSRNLLSKSDSSHHSKLKIALCDCCEGSYSDGRCIKATSSGEGNALLHQGQRSTMCGACTPNVGISKTINEKNLLISNHRICNFCGSDSLPLQLCGRCNSVYYCSKVSLHLPFLFFSSDTCFLSIIVVLFMGVNDVCVYH